MPKDTHPTLPADAELVLPERVTIALAELAGAARERLLALAVGTGLSVLHSLLDADVDRLVGPKGRHNPDRAAVRHGTQPSRVTLGGRRVLVDRPQVRSADGATELPLPTWAAFSGSEPLDQLTLERMLAKLSCRRYAGGLELVGTKVQQASSGTSKSAVSRRFVAATEHALARLLAAELSGLDLVALMGRRDLRRRAHLRGRAGDHPGRDQGPARPGRGGHRERHRGPRPVGRLAGPRAGYDPAHPGRRRRRPGDAPSGRRRIRPPRRATLQLHSARMDSTRPSPNSQSQHQRQPGR